MHRTFFTLLMLGWIATAGLAADGVSTKFPSPDGRFALRITESKSDNETPKIELIEKTSGKVMVDIETPYFGHRDDIVLVWSADSKRVAYGIRGPKEGEAGVYFWNGSAFEAVPLPDNLPDPEIKYRKGADGSVKNYGGVVKPLRWLKSGELELSSDSVMMSRVDNKTYTGTVLFTVAFDAQHHASVKTVGKTKTRIE